MLIQIVKKEIEMGFNECQDMMNRYNLNSTSQKNFLNFVYGKISRNTKNRFVDITENSVDILLSNHPCIKVIPIFKDINKESLSLDKEIKEATSIISNSQFKYVYFVYPKNENFDKHIEIKVSRLEDTCSDYMIKIIPYSLKDLKGKRKGKCNGNSNILCK